MGMIFEKIPKDQVYSLFVLRSKVMMGQLTNRQKHRQSSPRTNRLRVLPECQLYVLQKLQPKTPQLLPQIHPPERQPQRPSLTVVTYCMSALLPTISLTKQLGK